MDQKNQLLQYLFKNHPQYFNLNQTINLNQINWNKIPVNSLIESIQKNEKNFDLSSFIKNQNENQIKNQNENQIKNEEKKIDLNSFQKEFPINYNQISLEAFQLLIALEIHFNTKKKHEKLIQFIREKLDISENYYQKLVEIHLKSKNELEQISDLNFKLKLLSKISFINQNDWNFFFEWRQHQINIFIYELEKIFKKNSFKNDSQEIISKIQSLNSFGNKEGNDFNQQLYLKRIEEINNDLKQIMNQMKDFENDQKIPLLEDSIMIYFENLIEYFINLQEKVENNTLIFHLEQKEIKKIDSFQKFFSLSNFSTQVIIIKILWKKIKEVFQLEKKFSSKHDQLFLTFQTELKEIQSKEISPFLRGIFQEICSEMLVFMQNLKNYFEHFPEMISNFSKCFIILKTILNSKFNTKKIVKDFLLDHVRNLFPKNENENEQINLEFFGNLKDLIKDDLDFYSGIFFDQYSHVEKLLLKIYSQLYINFLNDFIEKHKYLDNTTLNIWKSGRLLIKFFMKKNISSNQFPNLQQFISQIFIDWMKTNTTNILSYISKIIEDEVFDVESRFFSRSIFDLWKVVVSIKEIFYQVLSQEIIELIAKPFFEDLYQIFRKYSRLVRITFSKSKKSNQQIISNESQKNQQIKQKSNQFIPNESQKNQQIKQKSNQQIISNESQKNQQIKQKSNQQIISNESQKNHQFITNESQRIKTIELIVDNKFPRYLISQNCVRLNNLSLVIDLFNKLCNEFKQKTEEMMKQEEYFDYGNILNENNNNNNNNEKNIKAFPFQTTQNKLKNFVKKKCVFPTAKFISSQIIFYQLREAFSFKLYLPDINYRINNVLIYLVSILSEIQNDLTNEEHKQNLFDFIYDDFLKCFEYVLLEGGRFYSPDDTPIIVEDLDFIIQFFAGKKNSDIKFSISEDQVNNKIQKIRKILLNLFPLSTENLISLFSTLGTIIQEKEPFIKINFQRILLERKDFQK